MMKTMKKKSQKMNNFISKEGVKPVGFLLIVSILVGFISEGLFVVFLLATLFVGYLFRNSKRYVFENSQSILAPVDGKIMAIDKIDDKVKIYCKVSLLDTHIVRAPINGEMKRVDFHKGLNLSPATLKAKSLNEQIKYQFSSNENRVIILELISGFFNVAIEKKENETVEQGQNIGFFLDGIVIVTLSNSSKLLVNVNDKLLAGQTILQKIED